MDKRQATEFLEYLLRDKNIERTIYEDALKIAIESLKAQLSQECTTKCTTSDLISKTETVEHLRRVLEATVPNTDYDEGYIDGIEFGISTVSTMPTIQPQSTAGQLNDSAQSTAQSTNLIDRQAAIDALDKRFDNIPMEQTAEILMLRKDLRELPTAQPEPAIPLSWVEKHIEWLKGLDNEFANLAAAHISVMVNKWRNEQGESN